MPDQHKTNPVTFRPPEGDRAWLYQHAERTRRSVGAILSQALAEYRAARNNHHATTNRAGRQTQDEARSSAAEAQEGNR